MCDGRNFPGSSCNASKRHNAGFPFDAFFVLLLLLREVIVKEQQTMYIEFKEVADVVERSCRKIMFDG